MKRLIITPTQKEFDFFLQGWAKLGLNAQNSTVGRLPVAQFQDAGITLACGGAGKAQFAVQTQHLLDACLEWDLVLCIGAAGGLVDELTIGDVVVATSTVEHDYHNKFSQRPFPMFEGAPTVIAELRRVALPNAFKVYFGVVASGDEDIVDEGRRRSLQKSTGALVVAWEGAGGARACAFNNVPFVEIRGVTDTANQNAPSDFGSNVEVVMSNLATLLSTWLDQCVGTSQINLSG
ncbi:MAG: acyltransferase [Acidobacteria bacterium]|nr:MAG: acyltransferase [Acidobacteriota bacterium]